MTQTATDPRDAPGTLRIAPVTDDIVALCLVGEFDMGNVSDITSQSDELLGSGKHLVLDFSEATFIDSHVVRALFEVATHAKRSGRVAVLELGTAAIVERVLEIMRVEQVIPRVGNRSDAIRAIRQSDGSAD